MGWAGDGMEGNWGKRSKREEEEAWEGSK